MSLILLILSIVGAIPDIIKAVEEIWALIQQIKNRSVRLEKTRKLKSLVLGHLSPDNKYIADNGHCVADLMDFKVEVKAALA